MRGLGKLCFGGLLFGTTFNLPTALMQGAFGENHSTDATWLKGLGFRVLGFGFRVLRS